MVIPNGVQEIGEYAFMRCFALKKIYIPKSVTRIGEKVFWGCDKIRVFCENYYEPATWSCRWRDKDLGIFGRLKRCKVYWGVSRLLFVWKMKYRSVRQKKAKRLQKIIEYVITNKK